MRAIILNPPAPGTENMVVTQAPEPTAAPDEVVIAVEVAGCNFADTMIRRGTYPHPKGYPLVAGFEIAGRVAAIGSDVTGVEIGERVTAFSEAAGGFAELCAVPAERLIRLPDTISLEQAAAAYVQAMTSWQMLHTVSETNPGDVLLVHAIGGGVGLYLTQIAVRAGATVIGTIGTRGKEKRPLEYGASVVINREDEDFVAAVMKATGGKLVDKIVDSTGGTILDRSFATIRKLGHVVSYGEAEGRPQTNLWERLVSKSLTFTRFHLGHSDFQSEAWHTGVRNITDWIADGSLKVPIEGVFEFNDVHAMFARLESRQVAGKLLLKIV
jgi:NADPH2:quinone reductase